MPLTAGEIAGPITSTVIPLVGTAATGGGGPVGYQWHYSLTPGFSPGPGNAISGATGLTLVHTGRTPSTTYYYRLAYSDGVQTAFSGELSATTTAAGGAIVILANPGYEVGNYVNLADAVATLGSDDGTIIVASPQTVSADLTVPTNVTLQFSGNGIITVASGKVLTVNGPLQASPVHIFTGARTVAFGNRFLTVAWVEWFGAVADGNTGNGAAGTDNTAAINAAIYAVPASSGTVEVRFAGHAYRCVNSLNIINNVANRNRRNLVLAGKAEGRRSNDANSGTCLVWGGDNTDAFVNLQSRNCVVQDLQIVAPFGFPLKTGIDVRNPGGLSQVVTTNTFTNIYFNAENEDIEDGILIGASGEDNQEHHRFQGCAFIGMTNAGIFVDNGTGQAKFLQVEDCAFVACRYGWLAQIASADFTRCNFSGISETCMRWTGGSYDPCTVTDCDNESSAQFVYAPGVDISFINTRLSCENATPDPDPGQEYIYGPNKLLLLNTQIQADTGNVFAIRPADGGYVCAISCDIPNRQFLPADISWQAAFFNCPNISDGTRKAGFGLTTPGHYLNVTETAGRLRVSNQGTFATINSPATAAFDVYWDAVTNYARLSQGGAYPNRFATVQPYGDTHGATAVFSTAAGSVPAGDYDYGYTVVTASGESTAIKFISQVDNGATGQWVLTNIPLGPVGTTSRKIYRSPGNAGTWKLITTLADNTTTAYTDTAAAGTSDSPVSDTSGLETSLALGTLTPTAVITAAGGTITAWDKTLVVLVEGVPYGVPLKAL